MEALASRHERSGFLSWMAAHSSRYNDMLRLPSLSRHSRAYDHLGYVVL